MWPEPGLAQAHLHRALYQRAGRYPTGHQTDRARLEALNQPEEFHITRFLAPYIGSTRGQYQAALLEWLTWCMTARVRMLDADRTLIEQWAAGLGKRVKPSTVRNKLIPVCGFYRWAHEEGLIHTDPGQYVRRPRQPRRSNQKWLDQDQAAALLAASIDAGPPISGAVHLFLLNGLRRAETLTARIEHLDHQDGRTVLLLPARKMGVMDRVSLPEATVTVLADCIGRRKRGLLLSPKRIPVQTLYNHLGKLSVTAGLDFSVRPHMLRATFITLARDAGVSDRDLIASAGWTSPAMLEYYDRAHAAIRRNASHRVADFLQPSAEQQSAEPETDN